MLVTAPRVTAYWEITDVSLFTIMFGLLEFFHFQHNNELHKHIKTIKYRDMVYY